MGPRASRRGLGGETLDVWDSEPSFEKGLLFVSSNKTPFWGEGCEEKAHQLLLPGQCVKY